MKCVCIKDLIFPGTGSHDFVRGKIYDGTVDGDGAHFINEGGCGHGAHGSFFKEHFIEIVESKITKHNKARQVHKKRSTQISAFVEWVASLSKTKYAAHQQLVAVINQAQKLLPLQ